MRNEYIKEVNFIEKSEMQKEIELIKAIIKTREELKANNKNFDYAGGELIDYYTYQIKANKAKLDYLIKEVKQKGFSLDMVSELKLRVC